MSLCAEYISNVCLVVLFSNFPRMLSPPPTALPLPTSVFAKWVQRQDVEDHDGSSAIIYYYEVVMQPQTHLRAGMFVKVVTLASSCHYANSDHHSPLDFDAYDQGIRGHPTRR